MTSDQIQAFLRNLLMIAGGFFINKGWVDSTTLTTIVGGAASVVGVIWSWLHWGSTPPKTS